MLCSRFKQISLSKTTSNNNVRCRCLATTTNTLKKCWTDSFLASVFKSKVDITKMTPIRFLLKDLGVTRFWSIWSRNINVGNVVRRCRRDRSVRGVIQCVRQTFLKSRKTLLLSATAAYKVDADDGDNEPPPCENNITDEDLQRLLMDLETIQDLIKKTLYCTKCHDRIVIDKKLPGVKYCTCKEPEVPGPSAEGWMPYMEAEDVIIWRKEYKPGQGLFAYKVYGRYKEVLAQNFAAIQVDGGYRRIWDSAVAALSIVERSANGVLDQAVLHWEVLWPRLFANRDYVYIRRHKEFDLSAQVVPTPKSHTDRNPAPTGQNTAPIGQNTAPTGQNTAPTGNSKVPANSEQIDTTDPKEKPTPKKFRNPSKFKIHTKPHTPDHNSENSDQTKNPPKAEKEKPVEKIVERPSVHSNAKRKAEEMYEEKHEENHGERAFVIISRSCVHPEVPETKNAIRVTEYWSHMVVKTLNGADHPGMEFVLTYYDEPAVGGMPPGVASWATGRAAPAFLMNMRKAANNYREYTRRRRGRDPPDFTPFQPDKVSYDEEAKFRHRDIVSEEDMESSKQGPDLESGERVEVTREQATQTEHANIRDDRAIGTNISYNQQDPPQKPEDADGSEKNEEDDEKTASWWRQLYPFYYFV